ncbi:MAG TPA: hypothetical protein VIM02_16095 [Rhizomicrobium sp.]|jgi:hypothetical protein
MTLPLSLAYADSSGSDIVNGQINFQNSISHVNVDTGNVWGDVSAASIAGGNSIDITTMNDTNVTNTQYNQSDAIAADLNGNMHEISGNADMTASAFCNSASVSTDPTTTKVYSAQECHAADPSAALNANVSDIGGNSNLASAAIGNTFEEDTNAPNAPVQNYQLNDSNLNATNNSSVWNVKGSVNVTGAAVGNTGQIIHYTTN